MAIIALLSDFGLNDAYVGQMKAACLSHAPNARLVDISHQVNPFNIIQGAFFLAATHHHLPAGAVVLAVVDPGVGTARRAVIARIDDRFYVAPDNGLLSLALQSSERIEAWELPAPEHNGASTFHGRDVFAPAAAKLASGADPSALGKPIRQQGLHRFERSLPRITRDGLVAHVMHIDRFGNCILNMPTRDWLPTLRDWTGISLVAPARLPLTLARTYGELPGSGLGLLPGSQDFLELALNRSSAKKFLDLRIGSLVRLAGGPA
ncbi:SAM hydrolase/SAM-dependent halogenase family protein [Desulfohalovibrio reitneri]|uniref:SAM hydrolase/SAM-dependent halogenase family protein n=1 Tax=Desulfohalovibrio reitneri TaxID=1307759 RepID=UPI0004A72E6F|nr:SAM-dependent chlorinase/fluorinase [Desulfohalovibrio reitneri]